MDDILKEFIAESWENLARLDQEIVDLEKSSHDPELLASIFRTIHTIKGTCGFIGLTRLAALAHAAENVLGQMREGSLDVSPLAVSLTLQAVDRIKAILSELETSGSEPEQDNFVLINQLEMLARIPAEFRRGSDKEEAELSAPVTQQIVEKPVPEATQVVAAVSVAAPPVASVVAVQSQSVAEVVTATAPTAVVAEHESAAGSVAVADVQDAAGPGGDGPRRPLADVSIRVNVDVLDRIMNLVGELVLTRNQLLQLSRGDEESRYAAPITHLNRVSAELQEGVMKTRMQPIGNAWSRLPRLVRDLTQVTGKQMELEMVGADTELDRTVLDAIRDPLTHMVRNSADHGIESPEVRRKKGKPEAGHIRLNAYHEGGHVIICIEDDGAGINLERVRQKAIERGVVSAADAARLSDNEITQFIFAPGFSTAEAVTSVSGRGVGMDVVKTQIERIGGTVDLQTAPNRGTTVRIRIPLTLAIISALIVESRGQSFAIPQLGVVELVRLAAEDRHKIERIHNQEVFRLRERLLPLIHLDSAMHLQGSQTRPDADISIVVVQVGEQQLGLIVDEVFDTEEIVVKPVGSLLKDIPIYQGTTILGDGRVIMILEVASIASEITNLSKVTSAISQADNDRESSGETTRMLVFNAGSGRPMAVPLSLVSRLEEFSRPKIERAGDSDVVQYRGDLLPLLSIDGYYPEPDRVTQPVIVFSENGHSMGLMVQEIEDILEERLVIRMPSQRPGTLGAAIINSRATEILDIQHYLLQARPDWFRHHQTSAPIRVLFVEDSVFFRQLGATSLEGERMTITTAENGQQALEMLDRGIAVDLILSDIDMPVMNGLEMARKIRSRSALASLPMVALTGNTSLDIENRVITAGFDRYVRKFDPEEVRQVILELMASRTEQNGLSA